MVYLSILFISFILRRKKRTSIAIKNTKVKRTNLVQYVKEVEGDFKKKIHLRNVVQDGVDKFILKDLILGKLKQMEINYL